MYRAQRKVYMNHKPLRNQHHVCLHFTSPHIIFSPSKNLRTSSGGADPAHLAPMDLNIELEWRWYWGNPSLSGWVPEERPRMEKSRGCDFLPLASKKAMSWIQSFLMRIEHLHDLYTVLGSHPLFSIRVSENGTRNNSFYGGLQGKMMINQWILDDFRVPYSQANPNGYPLVN